MIEQAVGDKAIGDTLIGLAEEISEKDRPDLTGNLAIFAYGFYRQCEDVEGMKKCQQYFQNPQADEKDSLDKVAFNPIRKYMSSIVQSMADEKSLKKNVRETIIEIFQSEGNGYLFESPNNN